ncbi:hypothetical protein FRC06_004705 [Ceratobasidium sp. 370]|nr:hypothetical protein FRC06_004705 [Ceratobasidium sp. 370]
MWEDIKHSGDGGLYGELLQNRAFQAVSPRTTAALVGWTAYNGTTIDVTDSTAGVSTALLKSLQVTVPPGSTGVVGFQNTGYWGIKVQSGWKYTGSFYVKSDSFTGPITVSLVSASGQVYATKTLARTSSSWKKLSFNFSPTVSAPDVNNYLRFSIDGAGAAGKTLYFGLFSLFPPTYQNRPNGMRIDLAEALAAIKPVSSDSRVGTTLKVCPRMVLMSKVFTLLATTHRAERRQSLEMERDNWALPSPTSIGYPNTDGLGLMEYLNWIEDIGTEPILGVWAGLGIGSGNPTVPENQIEPYVQDVVNEIEFIMGDASTNSWTKLRAQHGHHKPYKLKYIEIGNEDFFGTATCAGYRWKASSQNPRSSFEYLATTYPSTMLGPAYTYIGWHQYNIPGWFINHALEYDAYPRSGTQFFVGKYAVTSTNSSCIFGSTSRGRLAYPTLQGAAAEAAYITRLERNSDVIFAYAYAPTLQHVHGTQWTPDIISFDAVEMVKSASYYVQHMFGNNAGTHVIKTSPTPSVSAPLHWVASHDAKSKIMYVKMSNTATTQFTASFAFHFPIASKSVTLALLSAPVAATSNTLSKTTAVVPVTSSLPVSSGATSLNYTSSASSVAVFKLCVR